MTKDEKENLINEINDLRNHYLDIGGECYLPMASGLRIAISFIEDIPITEPKNINLKFYYDELVKYMNDGMTFCSALETVYYRHTGKSFNKFEALDWMLKPCDIHKYNITQFEYDLLKEMANLYGNDCILVIHTVILNMQKKGHFNFKIDDELTFKDVLENCEVINNDGK